MLGVALKKVLWRLVHLLYAIWLQLLVSWDLLDSWRSGNPRLLTRKTPPRHVALLVCSEKHTCEHLAQLLLWSLAAGVQYFTLYDRSGTLQKNEDELYAAVEKLKVNVPGRVVWTNRPSINGYKNGTSCKIVVNIFSPDDGKQRIVSLVKDMCSAERIAKVDVDNISVEEVDEYVRDMYPPLPEPNLAIYCGEVCCAGGFLPWHIRLTEFLSLGSHCSVRLEKFVQLLETYTKCEQRFGK